MFLKLITDHVNSFVSEHEIENLAPFINTNHELLNNKTGPGNNYLGWLDIAKKINSKTLESITNAANKIKSDSD